MNLRSLVVAIALLAFLNAAHAETKPLKVFVLVGQSNMQGHAQVRTLDHMGMDPRTRPLLQDIRSGDGAPRVSDNVWISYLSSGGEKHGRLTTGYGANEDKIGPELTFGIYMQKLLNEPILIIKTAWGGKSLHTDFRPPSAGPFEFSDTQIEQFKKQGKDFSALKAQKAEATGHYYRLTIDHVRKVLSSIKDVYPSYDPAQGHELAGCVWFQGWNDMVDRGVYPNRDKPGGYGQYSDVLTHFIRDLREDLSAPDLPFVIGVMGVGGPVAKYRPEQMRYAAVHQNFRDAMAAPAALPEFHGNVAVVLTENYWDMELAGLRVREAQVKQKAKQIQQEKKLDREQAKASLDELLDSEFTKQERMVLEKGVSNFEFHYLGCAKILAQIGKGFAEAFENISKNKQ